MLIFIGILFTLLILVFSVLNNIFLGFGLSISLLFFTFVALKRGYSLKKIGMLYWVEAKKSLDIIIILIFHILLPLSYLILVVYSVIVFNL